MKKLISLLTVLTLFTAFLSFAACKKNENTENTDTDTTSQSYSKRTTLNPVKIADIPEGTAERVEMLNAALDYIDSYCYKYTKNTKCSVSNVNVGSFSAASNAVDAFKSIFGQTDVTYDYDYNNAPESFAENFIKERFSESDAVSAEASQKDNIVTLKVTFPTESNPSDTKGQLHKLSTEYLSTAKVNQNLSEFASSASSVSILVSDITITASISSVDSSLVKLVVSYNESFTLSGVKLVQLEGSSVTGTSQTVETYYGIE